VVMIAEPQSFLMQIKKDGIAIFDRKALRFVSRKTIGLDWRSDIIAERPLNEPTQEI